VYSHLQRISLPPRLRLIKEKIIAIYPVLADYLLTFLVAAKYGESMEGVIQCIQAVRQAALPTSSFVDSFQLPCQTKIPNLTITNGVFRMWSEKRIYIHSQPQFSFCAMIYPSQAPPIRRAFVPIQLEDKAVDVGILMNRKPRTDAGNISILQPAHTSYHPEVFTSFIGFNPTNL